MHERERENASVCCVERVALFYVYLFMMKGI